MTASTSSAVRRPRKRNGWWGKKTVAPWERWPGVTLQLEGKWSAARKRYESPCGRYYFDKEAAERPARFFRQLIHTKGEWAGKPFELLDWQSQAVFRPLFGWKRVADGLRRFRHVFVIVAKKNGKSAIASGLALYLTGADGEDGAEVYSAAADEDQARIVYGEAANMAEANPRFRDALGLTVHRRSISQDRTRSAYKVLSRAVGTKHGFNVHGLIFDEFHTQRTRDLYETLYRGTSARAQPVVFVITTAGDDRETICHEQYEYAKGVLDGTIDDDTFLPVIFEADTEDDWTDPATWHKANPSLGVTKRIDYMETECAAAKAEPRKRNSFLRLDLNVWTESRTVWIAPEAFEALARAEKEPARLEQLTCCLGLDLSKTTDLTSCVAAFREHDELPALEVEVESEDGQTPPQSLSIDYRVHLVEWYWLPASRLKERARKDRVPYPLWRDQGWLRETPGEIVHYDAIRRHVRELHDRFKVVQAGFDPWNAGQLTSQLLDDGVPMVEVRQGYASLSGPSKLLEALVVSGRLTYSGSPLTRWCVANCELQSDPAGNIKPVKPDPKGARRIDGVSAAVIALSRLMVAPEPKKKRPMVSVLEW